jgi:nucleoside-diphosphate-sugar epimerase
MRVFLTGATGYLGSAALEAFARGGHEVTALVRTREQAEALQVRGIRHIVGTLAEPAACRKAAAGFDTYVHTAFDSSERGPFIDELAIEMLADAAAERKGATFIYTSGVWVLGPQPDPVDESAAVAPIARVSWRPAHEQRVLEAARTGVRAIVLRPGIVYGGSRGIIGDLFKEASNGIMRIIGSGENHWPLVYDRDLADLYVRLATAPDAAGVYHANDEGDERVIDIVEAIAGVAKSPPEIRRMPIEEARAKLGQYADALALNQIVRSPRARAIGWSPTLRSVADHASRLLEEWRRSRDVETGSRLRNRREG